MKWLIGLVVLALAGGGAVVVMHQQHVRVGEVVSCEKCRKELRNNVTTISRHLWEDSSDHVASRSELCDACGQQPVSYTVSQACKHCGTEMSRETKSAPLRDRPRNETIREAYCTKCDTAVAWTARVVCEGCGKFLRVHETTAKPRNNPKTEVAAGYCMWCKARNVAKNVGKRTGEIGGDVLEGLINGAENR